MGRRLLAGLAGVILSLMLGLLLPGWAVEIVPESPRLTIAGAADDDWELYAVSIDGGPVQRLTDDALQNAHPQLSPDGRWLLYEQRDDARKADSLFLRSTSSPTGRLLTGIATASFTPDSRLLFTEKIPNAKGVQEPWVGVMACDGSEKRLYREGNLPVISPNGKFIAFTDLHGNVVLISAEEKSEAVSLGKGAPCAFNNDGSLLVISRDYRVGDNLFTLPVVHVLAGEGAGAEYEVPEAERRNREYCWGFVPDGRLLCTRDGEGIFLTDLQRRSLTWITRSEDWAPEVTPDGTALVFLRLRGMWAQLCRINLDGSNFAPITSGLVDTPNFTLTPDGKTIIFSAVPHQGYNAATLVTRMPLSIAAYPPAVVKRDGIGLVPLRYLAEQIGAGVSWDLFHNRVLVTRQGKAYNITPSVGIMEGESLFVPIRQLIKTLGGTVVVPASGDQLYLDLPGLGRMVTLPILPQFSLSSERSLFLFSLDGASQRGLTFNPPGSTALPLVSPDGQWLVMPGQRRTLFTGERVYLPSKSGIIIRRADDPTERRLLCQLADGSGYSDFVFSPDGTTLLFTRKIEVRTPVNEGGRRAVRITYREELGQVTLADGKVWELGIGRDAVFSPDGAWIAFVREEQVWLARRDGSHAQRICLGFAPRFTPDGANLVVHRMREGMSPDERATGINATLLLCRLDGTEVRQVGRGRLAGFSPDGKTFYAWEARVRPDDRTHALYLGSLQRVEYTTLRGYALYNETPGEVVLTGVFQETALGATHAVALSCPHGYENAELRAAPYTGGPARLLATGRILAPRFTPDGRYVLFIKDGDLCMVNVDGGDVAQITWGAAVDEYTLTPDGTHLLVYGRLRE